MRVVNAAALSVGEAGHDIEGHGHDGQHGEQQRRRASPTRPNPTRPQGKGKGVGRGAGARAEASLQSPPKDEPYFPPHDADGRVGTFTIVDTVYDDEVL